MTISGDVHSSTYYLTKLAGRAFLTVEALRAGPIKVSGVRDPSVTKGYFFYVEDTDTLPGNYRCSDLE